MTGFEQTPMDHLLGRLLLARNVAHVLHWKTKSFAMHLALGELYEELIDLTDELAEIYMGKYGDAIDVNPSSTNEFSMEPLAFIKQLDDLLHAHKEVIPQDGWLINKYEELQGAVHRVKYKLENLH